MALCVHCGHLVDSLYSVYGESNIVCTKCPVCRHFADPYLEHDALLVVLDLLLVKPRVYRHLLFNRTSDSARARTRWSAWLRVARCLVTVILVDAYLRWTALYTAQENVPEKSTPLELLIHKFFPYARLALVPRVGTLSDLKPVFGSYALVVLAIAIETLSWHGVILFLTCITRCFPNRHRELEVVPHPDGSPAKDEPTAGPSPPAQEEAELDLSMVGQGIGAEDLFECSLVPWALILSSLTPLLLLLLNFLWRSEGDSSWGVRLAETEVMQPKAGDTGPEWLRHVVLLFADQTEFSIDWVARTLIGGVSAGVALGVLLPRRPVATVLILCAATYVQTTIRYTLHIAPAAHGRYAPH